MHENAVAMWRYVRKQHAAKEILIWGHSLGSAVSVNLMATLVEEWEIPAGVVLEAPLASIAAVVADTWLRLLPNRSRIISALRSLLYDNFDSMGKLPIDDFVAPVLVLHGQRDAVVPYSHGKALSEKAGFAFEGFPEANHQVPRCNRTVIALLTPTPTRQNIVDQADLIPRFQRWVASQVLPGSNPQSPNGLREGSPNSELIREIQVVASWEDLAATEADADGFALA